MNAVSCREVPTHMRATDHVLSEKKGGGVGRREGPGGKALARTKQRWQGEMHISLARAAAGDLMKGVVRSYK